MAKTLVENLEKMRFFSAMKERNNGFLGDADGFSHSNRFNRFKEYVEEKLNNRIQELPIIEKYQIPSFVSLIRETLADFVSRYNDDFTDDSHFVTDTLSASPNRYTSNLLLLNAMFQEINKKEISCNELEPVIIGAVLNNLKNDSTFLHCYIEALTRACFDYVSIQTFQHSLVSENWLRICKENLDANSLLLIAMKTFEYSLHNLADSAAFDCLSFNNDKNAAPALLMRVDELSKEKESYVKTNEKIVKEIQQALEEERQNHQETQERYKKLKDSTADTITTAEIEQMKAEIDSLKAAKQKLSSNNIKLMTENQRIKDEYQSLSDYVDILTSQEAEEEPELSDVPTEDSDIWYKRIVFIRDKKDEGYLLMQKLSEMFPNSKFTNGIASDIDVHCTDAIVALIAYTCHGTYWGASGIAKRNNIPFVAIKNKNVNIIASRIQKEINNRKES